MGPIERSRSRARQEVSKVTGPTSIQSYAPYGNTLTDSQVEVTGDEEVDEDGNIDIMGYKFGNVPTYMILRVRDLFDAYGV